MPANTFDSPERSETHPKGYIVELPRETYISVKENLPPSCRFTNVEQWGFDHLWLYSPDGSVVIFCPPGAVVKGKHATLKGFANAR